MFVINGIEWNILYVNPNSHLLQRSDGVFTFGVTDFPTRIVYINNRINGEMLTKVITHEIVHCLIFSYGIDYSIDEEEKIADFIATFGREVINVADNIIKLITMVV